MLKQLVSQHRSSLSTATRSLRTAKHSWAPSSDSYSNKITMKSNGTVFRSTDTAATIITSTTTTARRFITTDTIPKSAENPSRIIFSHTVNPHHRQYGLTTKSTLLQRSWFSQWNARLLGEEKEKMKEKEGSTSENTSETKEENKASANEAKDEKQKNEKEEQTTDTATSKQQQENEAETKREKKEDQEDDESEKDSSTANNGRNMATFLIAAVLLAMLLLANPSAKHAGVKEITFKDLVDNYLRTGKIERLDYDTNSNIVYVYLKKDSHHQSFHDAHENFDESHSASVKTSDGAMEKPDFFLRAMGVENFEEKLQIMEERIGIPASKSTNVIYRDDFNATSVIVSLLDIAIILGLIFFLQRRSGRMMNMFGGAGKITVRTDHKIKTTFKDVAGMSEAKQEIVEFVDFLKNPGKYRTLGAKLPRGAILMGPPGTGKTLLAKAVAGEANVPFFSISGSDFVEMFVGVGPARVRDLFKQARSVERAIIYIDEIDAIGRPRGTNAMHGGGNDERENTLNQLLVEMDGFQENTNIIVLASTNVEKDGLDPALLRPGRFDRQITVDKPDQKERIEIFKVHLKPLTVAQEVTDHLDRLAELTPGMSGADIANVCNEGAIFAARKGREEVTIEDIEAAIERVIGGLEKKNAPITPEEKKVIAYHEAGHAIVAWFCKFCDPLLKISIIPRGKALGYAQYVPQETYIKTHEQLQDMLVQALGGRVAEEYVFRHLSTGAKDDLQKITQIAYAAVSTYGMSDSVGPVSFPPPGDPSVSVQKPYGEETAWHIDTEVRSMIASAYERAKEILKEKEDLLHKVAQFLIKEEAMNIDQFRELAGPRPFASDEKGVMPAEVINLQQLQIETAHIILPPDMLRSTTTTTTTTATP